VSEICATFAGSPRPAGEPDEPVDRGDGGPAADRRLGTGSRGSDREQIPCHRWLSWREIETMNSRSAILGWWDLLAIVTCMGAAVLW